MDLDPVYDLYAASLPSGVLDKLCKEVRLKSKICADKKIFILENVCAGGVKMALNDMNSYFPIVFLLQGVLNE